MKRLVVVIWALALLAACTSPKPAETEKPKPKEPDFYTGRYAFQKMYLAARGWARDAQPYSLSSETTPLSTGKDGKSDLWHASFASPLQHAVKPYTWSGTDAPNSPRGVSPGIEDNYSPTNASTQIFDVQFLKVDSEKALEEAQKHGGDKILESAPNTPIVYQLEWRRSDNKLIWHVSYGGAVGWKLRVDVDASTGDFVRVEK